MVFPLGMYAAATFRLMQATNWQPLRPVVITAGVVAVVAWTIAFAGLAFEGVSSRE
jgi:tellurite resistance protein TehA-like permease